MNCGARESPTCPTSRVFERNQSRLETLPDRNGIKKTLHEVDVCVVGGGMAGICAALSAARHGARVVLMHERPVLGGNASSETRVHICGADHYGARKNMRETGVLEELRLENARKNPNSNFSVWDAILYEKVHFQPGLQLLLNCTCLQAEMSGGQIASVTGWQLTTETYHRVTAKIFIDCSGDGILAPLTGAQFRMGREGRSEFGESIAPESPDDCTMGMTICFQSREYDSPQVFEKPSWAYTYDTEDELPYGAAGHSWWTMGYWWVELGGEHHSIYDTECLRDELLKISLGVWDHIKNKGDHGADNWALEWLQFLPAKRESRRYIGDHVLTQLDVESEGRFDDIVAYGGWSMDDHHPAGFLAARLGAPATVFHPAPAPYGIPYRCLCSRNVENLMFAGRCASATHSAMSSTRVMGTGCSMGQAAGTAAAMATEHGLSPLEVGTQHIHALQQTLIRDDSYIPWVPREISAAVKTAEITASCGDPEPVRDGWNRPVGDDEHCWRCSPGDWVAYTFAESTMVDEVSLVLDSALDDVVAMSYHQPQLSNEWRKVPDKMAKALHVDGLVDGEWVHVAAVEENYQRLVVIPVGRRLHGVRVTVDALWGRESTRVFAFYVD